MSKSVHRAPRGAKAPVCPELGGSPGQTLFLAEARAVVEQLIRRGAHVTHHRRGTPEQVTCAFIAESLRTALRFLDVARREGRSLTLEQPKGWCSRTLVMGAAPVQVIDLAPYLAARKGCTHV